MYEDSLEELYWLEPSKYVGKVNGRVHYFFYNKNL